jgi:hypothetical protein
LVLLDVQWNRRSGPHRGSPAFVVLARLNASPQDVNLLGLRPHGHQDAANEIGMATMQNVARAGALFVVLFVAGFVLLGDLIGSFADADRAFVDHFAEDDNRLKDIVGAYLLLLAALCLTWFTVALAAKATDRRVPLIAMGSVAAGAMVMAALALCDRPVEHLVRGSV